VGLAERECDLGRPGRQRAACRHAPLTQARSTYSRTPYAFGKAGSASRGWAWFWMVPTMFLWVIVLGAVVYAAVRLANHDSHQHLSNPGGGVNAICPKTAGSANARDSRSSSG
jgi:hypothetical protein